MIQESQPFHFCPFCNSKMAPYDKIYACSKSAYLSIGHEFFIMEYIISMYRNCYNVSIVYDNLTKFEVRVNYAYSVWLTTQTISCVNPNNILNIFDDAIIKYNKIKILI